ncbi:MAG: nucleoside monophosphate kinase [Patescibacteria group bacterium]
MLPDAIFMMGPQGSGKGTQAGILAGRLNFFHWDMGAVLRQERDRKLSSGETVGEIVDTGTYLTDAQLIEILESRLSELPLDKGIIFDAVPRRLGQAEFLLDFLRKRGKKIFYTVYIDIPHEESIKRLLLRAKAEGRADDTRESIEKRLKQHKEATLPILDYMCANTVFMEIDGRLAIPEVTAQINRALGLGGA